MINYHFKIIVITGGFTAKQTHKKSWLRRYRGKKRIRTEKLVLAEEKSWHNLRQTWHRLLAAVSLLPKEQCWEAGAANSLPQHCSPCRNFFGSSFCCSEQNLQNLGCARQSISSFNTSLHLTSMAALTFKVIPLKGKYLSKKRYFTSSAFAE